MRISDWSSDVCSSDLGGVAQLLVQWVALARLGLLPRYSARIGQAWSDPTVKRILRQMLPAILGVSVAQLSLLINTNIATWLRPGSVTWLSFAEDRKSTRLNSSH